LHARRTTPVHLVAAVLVLVGLTAAGCAKSTAPSAEAGGPTDTAQRASVSIPAKGQPVDGGQIVYGTEAETDGFDPTKSRMAISALLMANTVLDPIAAHDASGKAQPYLATSITPNADFTEWTLGLRPGVTFSNGQPLDAAAGIQFVRAIRDSLLTGPAARPIKDAVAAGDDVKILMDRPWPAFPQLMTGQGGLIIAPEQLDRSAAGDPRAANEPIGTGPFTFQEWQKNDHFIAVKNPKYWQAGLPHLERVEFRPIVNLDTRVTALEQGTIDVTHVDRALTVQDLRQQAQDGRFQFFAGVGEDEESFIMINNQEAPLSDRTLRQALAYGTDLAQVASVTGSVPSQYADGPWGKDSAWYAESGYPAYD
jgi:peptide/nickel transport system substrate-binding protein